MTAYLAQVNVGLILFYGAYYFLLRGETNFKICRTFLMVGLMSSVLIPIMDIEKLLSVFVSDPDVVNEYWLPGVAINSVQVQIQIQKNEMSDFFWPTIGGIYWIGVAIGTLSLLISFIRLGRLVSQSRLVQDDGGHYYVLDQENSSFSFFNLIFIGSKAWYTDQDKRTILVHEQSHARRWHSADVLLIQLIKILVWFNPIVYAYRSELEKIHEFEADSLTCKNEVDDYCYLLTKDVLDRHQIVIANHFNKSTILKRINMMKAIKTKMTSRKKVGLLVVLAAVLVAIACEEKVFGDLNEPAALLTTYPTSLQQNINAIQRENPDALIQVYGIFRGSSIDIDRFSQKHGTPVLQLFRDEDPNYESYLLINKNRTEITAILELRQGDILFSRGVVPAKPVDGFKSFYQLIAEKIAYPKQARESGVEGQVIAKFAVDETGKLSDFEIVRGIEAGCDREVIRALKLSPNWTPSMKNGLSLKSTFNIAFTFKLEPALETAGRLEERALTSQEAAQLSGGSPLSEIVISGWRNNK